MDRDQSGSEFGLRQSRSPWGPRAPAGPRGGGQRPGDGLSSPRAPCSRRRHQAASQVRARLLTRVLVGAEPGRRCAPGGQQRSPEQSERAAPAVCGRGLHASRGTRGRGAALAGRPWARGRPPEVRLSGGFLGSPGGLPSRPSRPQEGAEDGKGARTGGARLGVAGAQGQVRPRGLGWGRCCHVGTR